MGPLKIVVHRPVKGRLRGPAVWRASSGRSFLSILCEGKIAAPEPNARQAEESLDYAWGDLCTECRSRNQAVHRFRGGGVHFMVIFPRKRA